MKINFTNKALLTVYWQNYKFYFWCLHTLVIYFRFESHDAFYRLLANQRNIQILDVEHEKIRDSCQALFQPMPKLEEGLILRLEIYLHESACMHAPVTFSYPEPFLRAVNRARRGALAKSKPDTIKTWYPVKHCACSTSNADKHFGFLVCFVLKVFLQENPTKAVGFANFIYLNQLVGKT